MKRKPEMIILVGNIGSGKSTICKNLVKQGYLIISQDDLRYSIGAGTYIFNLEYEQAIKNTALELTRSFMQKQINIVIDETNMSKIIRAKYLNLARIYGYTSKCILMPILSQKQSVTRRLKNNHGKNSKKIWDMVWTVFDTMYEEPRKHEGFKEIVKL